MFATLRRGLMQAVLVFFIYALSVELRRQKERANKLGGHLAERILELKTFRRAIGNELNLSHEATASLSPQGAAEQIAVLRIRGDEARAEVRRLRKQLADAQKNNHARNLALDALHYVWCAGGCDDGVHRHDGHGADAITPEIVDAAIRNTERLVTWSRARVWKASWMKLSPDAQGELVRLRAENASLRGEVERLRPLSKQWAALREGLPALMPQPTIALHDDEAAPEEERGYQPEDIHAALEAADLCPHAWAKERVLDLEAAARRSRNVEDQVKRFAALANGLACRAGVAVMVLVRRGDGHLLMRHQGTGDELGQGLWTFPVGVLRVEEETIAQAARRIAAADGLALATIEPLAVTTYDRYLDEGTGFVTVYVTAQVNETPIEGEDSGPFLSNTEGRRWIGMGDALPPKEERYPSVEALLALGVDPWVAHATLRASSALAWHVGEQRAPVDLLHARELALILGGQSPAGQMINRLAGQVQHLRTALERDKTGLARALSRVRQLVKAGDWAEEAMTAAQVEERAFQATLQHLLPEIEGVVVRALRDSGSLVTQGFRGEPLTPDAPMSIEQALSTLLIHRGRLEELLAAVWQASRVLGEDPLSSAPVLAWRDLQPTSRAIVVEVVMQVLRTALGMTDDGMQLQLFVPPRARPEDLAARLVTFTPESPESPESPEGVLEVGGIALLTTGLTAGETLREALRAALTQALSGDMGDEAPAGEEASGEVRGHPTMGLWRYHGIEGGKYLVRRRDGSKPPWPYFVLGAKDPAASAGLLAYAAEAEHKGFDPQYVLDVQRLAGEFERYRLAHGTGDPDAPPARPDDPATVGEMVASDAPVKG